MQYSDYHMKCPKPTIVVTYDVMKLLCHFHPPDALSLKASSFVLLRWILTRVHNFPGDDYSNNNGMQLSVCIALLSTARREGNRSRGEGKEGLTSLAVASRIAWRMLFTRWFWCSRSLCDLVSRWSSCTIHLSSLSISSWAALVCSNKVPLISPNLDKTSSSKTGFTGR